MSVLTPSENLKAAVQFLLANGNEDLVAGLYRKPQYDRILKNPVLGGGSRVKLRLQVNKQTATAGGTLFVSPATADEDLYRAAYFDYKQYSHSILISNAEVAMSSDGENGFLLKQNVESLKSAIRDKIDIDFWQDTEVGLPSIWTGATYGELTRASFTSILASTTAVVGDTIKGLSAFATTPGSQATPAQNATKWDLNSLDKLTDEGVVKAISLMIQHIGDDGDEPTVVFCAKDVYARLDAFVNSKGFVGQWGAARSFTATGESKGFSIKGIPVFRVSNMVAGEVFVLNENYLQFASPKGYATDKITPEVKDGSTIKLDTTLLFSIVLHTLCCKNGTRQGWIVNANKNA